MALGNGGNGVLQLARIHRLAARAGVGVDKAGQHPPHILRVAGNALAVNQALQGAVVVLGAAQIFLKRRIALLIARRLQPQHLPKQLRRLRRQPLEHLKLALRERALRNLALRKLLRQRDARQIALAAAFIHAEIQPLARFLVHHIQCVAPKARQRRVAPVLQLHHIGGAICHILAQRRQHLGARWRLLCCRIQRAGNGLARGRQRGRIQHLLPQPFELLLAPLARHQAQHICARRHLKAAVNGSARLAIQADLLIAQPEVLAQLRRTEHHARAQHLLLKARIHRLVVHLLTHPFPRAQHIGVKQAMPQQQPAFFMRAQPGVLRLQVIKPGHLAVHIARPRQRAFKQRRGHRL